MFRNNTAKSVIVDRFDCIRRHGLPIGDDACFPHGNDIAVSKKLMSSLGVIGVPIVSRPTLE